MDKYKKGVTRATEHFNATKIRQEKAGHLKTQEGQPAMLVKRLAYHDDKLVEYTISVARGDKIS
ncbi:UTRA domain-containing protein [Oceanobacillus sp. HCA-5259]|uniref:UTRA domain-containing protein n=1 Tax=Oceanobacillus sp. HCA-5259 TaxID=3134661 RepID=UPI00404072A5